MCAIFALSRAQLLLLVVTRSRDLSRECHVTKYKTPAKSNFPSSNFENSGPFNSAHRALQVEGCASKILKKGRTLLLLIVVTRSRDLSRECHVTKHKTPARSNFPMSNFENSGTIQFSSSRSTSRGLYPKKIEKRAHPIAKFDNYTKTSRKVVKF